MNNTLPHRQVAREPADPLPGLIIQPSPSLIALRHLLESHFFANPRCNYRPYQKYIHSGDLCDRPS